MNGSSNTAEERRVGRAQLAFFALLALFAVYVVSDAVYRLWLYSHLEHSSHQHTRYDFSSTEAPLYTLDRHAGYSYRTNLKLHFRLYDRDNHVLRENHLITNNFGHFELEDDSLAKPDSEFRIAILGDSFSSTPTSDVTWPTELQADLNNDPAIKKITGKSTFKVINFGLDGTGLVQWPSVYKYKAKPFDPDLVIVNVTWNDLYRQFIYRDTININGDDRAMVTCSTLPAVIASNTCLNAYSFVMNPEAPDYHSAAAQIKGDLYNKMVARLPWFTPYPELLAVLLNGKFGLHPRLRLRDGSMFYFDSSKEAVAASQRALRDIASQQHAVMALFHPSLEECLTRRPQEAVKELISKEKDVTIENMLEFLPLNSNQDEIKKWYNVPYDEHPSDYGAAVYARAVAGRVVDYLSKRNASVAKAPGSPVAN